MAAAAAAAGKGEKLVRAEGSGAAPGTGLQRAAASPRPGPVAAAADCAPAGRGRTERSAVAGSGDRAAGCASPSPGCCTRRICGLTLAPDPPPRLDLWGFVAGLWLGFFFFFWLIFFFIIIFLCSFLGGRNCLPAPLGFPTATVAVPWRLGPPLRAKVSAGTDPIQQHPFPPGKVRRACNQRACTHTKKKKNHTKSRPASRSVQNTELVGLAFGIC